MRRAVQGNIDYKVTDVVSIIEGYSNSSISSN